MGLFSIFDDNKQNERTETDDGGKLRLHKEELDINKREEARIEQNGDIKITSDKSFR